MKSAITADDCRTCGACCVSGSDDVAVHGYADLLATDVARVSPHVRRQLLEVRIFDEDRYATRAKEIAEGLYACQFLRGTPARRCSCTIYETRPDVCRDFKVGGPRCRTARLLVGLDGPEDLA